MTTIYILKCMHNKWYIGKTNRSLIERLNEHFINNGSEWTKIHPPIDVVQIITNVDEFDEDKYTKEYMKKYNP